MDEGLDETAYQCFAAQYRARKRIRHTMTNAEEKLRLLNAMITAANTQPDKDVTIGSELIHDFVLREADEIQEQLVYANQYSDVLMRLVQMLNEEVPSYIERRNSSTNARLRSLYKRNGLHGMFTTPSMDEPIEGEVCVVCCDGEPTGNVSTSCKHALVLCSGCIKRLGVCPVCMAKG